MERAGHGGSLKGVVLKTRSYPRRVCGRAARLARPLTDASGLLARSRKDRLIALTVRVGTNRDEKDLESAKTRMLQAIDSLFEERSTRPVKQERERLALR